MKASLFLAATGAMMAMAGPINKRAMETEWVLQVVTVTVTAGAEPTQSSDAVFLERPTSTRRQRPQRPSLPPVVEAPVFVPTSRVPAPARPTTTVLTSIAPQPAPTQEQPQPQPEPTTEQAQPEQPAPSAPAAPGPGADYKTTVLYQHNIHRANHSAPDLEWDDTLAGYASNTANSCKFAHDMNQGNGGYGQNLASWGASGDISGKQIESAAGGITNQWYNDEMQNWSFYGQNDPPASSDLHLWGHFTQVVWKSSTKVGCATVQCPAGTVLGLPSWYTVCNYNPPGNFGGQYGANVLQPLGNPRVTA